MKTIAMFLLLFAPFAAFASMRQGELGALPAGVPLPDGMDLPDTLETPTFLETIGLSAMSSTRGERNNNPGNLRPGAKWQGLAADQTDPGYLQFTSTAAGIRAMAKLLKNYQSLYGLDTVRGIISRWAPDSENNTAAYIRAVSAALGVGPDQQIDTADRATLTALVTAIIRHENGRIIYTAQEIQEGVNQA